MLYIFLLAIIVSSVSIVMLRKGDCGFLPYNCPEYFVRGYPIRVWWSNQEFNVNFGLFGFFANTIIYFALIYILYFGYELVSKVIMKKK